jgi:hypothetical protein
VAVVVDAVLVRRWTMNLIEQLAEADFVEFARVVRVGAEREQGEPRARRWSQAVWSLYCSLDRLVFGMPHDALSGADVPAETIAASEAAAELSESDLDVIAWLGRGEPPRGLLDCARVGVWSIRLPDLGAGAPPAPIGSAGEGRALAVSFELTTRDDPVPRTIARSYSPLSMSLHRNRIESVVRATALLMQTLRRISAFGPDGLEAGVEEGTERDAQQVPRNSQAARHAFRVARTVVARRLSRAWNEEEWVIGYRRRTEPPRIPPDPGGFAVFSPPNGRSYADPFLLTYGGRRFIFFEDYSDDAAKAVISYAELYPDSSLSPPRVALERCHHLSYPFVFQEDGAVFMVPETAATRSVELYRARRFPDEWVLDRVLLEDIDAVDATLFRDGGRLWLFVATRTEGARPAWNDLNVFYADSLEDAWVPHALNPVLSDVRSARPAGRAFRLGHQLIRPGQDGTHRYGSAVVFNRIMVLDPENYDEVTMGRLGPEWLDASVGAHTYNFDSEYEVVDGKRMRWRLGRAGRPAIARRRPTSVSR